ncbi:ketol-acid reductoisomerase [Tuberibacillus sp. Marseille-P3662]|uniref:ketol-acid reductoisomerase n=1 Tax=Tuberibacillus sp. Marseille-P3662 TaxID=1965358 RepID=UPI000A1CDB80|nr:ketol-acid reductoisomerase [Tuberibacillus sp. Marseille-P3662]
MANIYYDKDADLEILKNKVIAIIGYGNQGRSQALNLRDSGVKNVIVGSVRDQSWDKAKEDGFEAFPIEEACQKADIIFMLIPDEIAPSVYEEKVRANLTTGNVLNFASGYNVVFGNIDIPENVDVIMVAPRMIGEGVRELYQSEEGFPSFVAVEQDSTGDAKDIVLSLAKAIGSTKNGAIEATFKDEAYLDLTAEQITWPLILSVLTEIYEYQVEMGHPEEAVLMELYLSKEPAFMMEKMADIGLFKQLPLHSNTSQYGQLSRYKKVDNSYIRDFIRTNYEYIDTGQFAKEWRKEQKQDLKNFKQMREEAFENKLSKAESRLKERLNL